MGQTVFITGSSSGIGRATALYFHHKGWKVIATMRRPESETELNKLPDVLCLKLDVTKPGAANRAVRDAIRKFGTIDVLVNNAGYGLFGPIEMASDEAVTRQIGTNLLGTVWMIRAVLPYMRRQGKGVIVNLSSNAGKISFPYYSLYNASKFAVEGLSESLSYELAPFGIRVKVIEPGPVATDFFSRSASYTNSGRASDYDADSTRILGKMHQGNRAFLIRADRVARLIYRAAGDSSDRLRYPAGIASRMMLAARQLLPDGIILPVIRLALVRKE